MSNLSGLAKTARGPSMSCDPGKVHILGIETILNEKVFVLKFLQARNPAWNDRVFFAKYDETAIWLNDLKPAFGENEFFYEKDFRKIKDMTLNQMGSSGQIFQDSEILNTFDKFKYHN